MKESCSRRVGGYFREETRLLHRALCCQRKERSLVSGRGPSRDKRPTSGWDSSPGSRLPTPRIPLDGGRGCDLMHGPCCFNLPGMELKMGQNRYNYRSYQNITTLTTKLSWKFPIQWLPYFSSAAGPMWGSSFILYRAYSVFVDHRDTQNTLWITHSDILINIDIFMNNYMIQLLFFIYRYILFAFLYHNFNIFKFQYFRRLSFYTIKIIHQEKKHA